MRAAWGKPLAPDMFPCLSLRQPWLYAVMEIDKRCENRSWSTSFRGEFLLHASAGVGVGEYFDAADAIEAIVRSDRRARFDSPGPLVPPREEVERGGIVGVARLVRVIAPCDPEPELFEGCLCGTQWHRPNEYGFILDDVRELPFTPWKGALGFFGVPKSVALPLLGRAA